VCRSSTRGQQATASRARSSTNASNRACAGADRARVAVKHEIIVVSDGSVRAMGGSAQHDRNTILHEAQRWLSTLPRMQQPGARHRLDRDEWI
jgi:hypothetical protein